MNRKNGNIEIRFHSMKEKKSQHLEEYLESLLRYSPSNAIIRFHIFKESNGYLCKLVNHSEQKTFSSHKKAEKLSYAIKSVLRDVKKQVSEWKKARSSLELTGLSRITQLDLQTLEDDSPVRGAGLQKKVA